MIAGFPRRQAFVILLHVFPKGHRHENRNRPLRHPPRRSGPARREDKTAAPVHADSGASVIDGIAAKINNDVITISDVMAEIRRDPELRTMGRTLQDETTFRRLYRDTVEAMVDRRLVLKAAVDAKMELQDWVVDKRVWEIVKEGFDGDINRLYVALADSHIPFEEWRRTIREDLIVSRRYALPGRWRRT